MAQKPSDDLLTLVMSCARPGPQRFPELIASVCLHTRTKPNDVRSAIELQLQRGELQLDVEMRLCAMNQKPSDALLSLAMDIVREPRRVPDLVKRVVERSLGTPPTIRLKARALAAVQLLTQRGDLELDPDMNVIPTTHRPAAAFNAAMISGFLQDLSVRLDTARAAGKDKVALCALELEILLRMADD